MLKLFPFAIQVLLGLSFAVQGTAVHAEDSFPTRTIKLVVPYAAGGATDIVARILATEVGPELGQNMIVENRGGGAGSIGTMTVVQSSPDGHTLVLATTTQLINQFLSKQLGFDLFTDLVPVALVADAPLILAVTSKLKIDDMKSFISAARASSTGFNCGSPGVGSVPHLGCEVLGRSINARIVHVPYRGTADALREVASGDIQLSFATQASLSSFIGSNLVMPLAVFAPKRISTLPKIPTSAEAGAENVRLSNWFESFVPKGTSPAIVARLNKAFDKALTNPEVNKKITNLGIEPVIESSDYFAKQLQEDGAFYKKIIDEIGLKPQ